MVIGIMAILPYTVSFYMFLDLMKFKFKYMYLGQPMLISSSPTVNNVLFT